MSEFDHKITVNAPAADVFAFISDPANMPKYLPTLRSATVENGDQIRVEGDVEGRQYVSEGNFRVDEAARRIEWEAGDERDYSGWLGVAGDDITSTVSAHLHFGGDPQIGSDPGASIHQGLVWALESIQNIVEGKGRKIEHDIYGGTHDGYSNQLKTR